jgi:hypothetical protein
MAVIRDFIDGQFKDDAEEPVEIGGIKTIARVREKVSRTREVPTTYLEDGSHVNDHIIRNPLTLQIEGSVSNVYRAPSPAVAAQQTLQSELGNITQYAPGRTQAQLSRISGLVADLTGVIDRVDTAIQSGQQAARFLGFTSDEGKTNIENFIDKMEGWMNSDALTSIDMPFRTYRDMAITSLDYERNNQTDSLTFTIEAQQFRFVQTLFVEASAAPNPAAGNNGAQAGEADKGAQEGEDVPESLGSQGVQFIRGFFE